MQRMSEMTLLWKLGVNPAQSRCCDAEYLFNYATDCSLIGKAKRCDEAKPENISLQLNDFVLRGYRSKFTVLLC